MSEAPMPFTWDAEHGVMIPRRRAIAMRTYVDGEEYRLGVIEERSANSHNHFFAALTEAWNNLPEQLASRYPTVEHFRKTGLIETGFCDTHTLVCSSKAEALRVAAFVRPIDEFSIVVAKGHTVTRFVAKSQSYRAMDKGDFAASKSAVLEWAAAQIRVSSAELGQNAGRAA